MHIPSEDMLQLFVVGTWHAVAKAKKQVILQPHVKKTKHNMFFSLTIVNFVLKFNSLIQENPITNFFLQNPHS